MPFGIASAPAIFQQSMEKILQGIPHVVCYIDDVLVTGGTEEEHTKNLAEVLKRFEEWGLWLKLQKCFFMQGSVEYLGYVIDAQGLHTAPEKVKAVVDTPQPKNQQQLWAFLGLVNGFYPSISINKLHAATKCPLEVDSGL